jgi:glutamine synthetase type III
MANYRNSRIFPIALVLIIAAIAIAALVSLTRAIFFNTTTSTNQTTVSQVDAGRQALLSTTVDRSVSMTVRGAIVADEKFHSYQITVTPSSRTMSTYIGYLDTTVDNVRLGNNTPSYEQFVYSLDRANLAKGSELSGDKNDTRGICATGQVYEFAILQSDKSVKTLWTSTCTGSKGSLDASVDQLTQLFVNQIPNATQLINKIGL